MLGHSVPDSVCGESGTVRGKTQALLLKAAERSSLGFGERRAQLCVPSGLPLSCAVARGEERPEDPIAEK